MIISLYIDIRENVGNQAKRADLNATLRQRHQVKKQDIANIQRIVRDMTVIRNKDDALSVDLFVQELREEPYDPVLLYKRQHELDQQFSSLPSIGISNRFSKRALPAICP